MKLGAFSNRITFLVVGMLAVACVSVLLTFLLAQERRDALIDLHHASDALGQLQQGSDQLTLSARSYAVNGDERYRRAFVEARDAIRVRDREIEQFLAVGLPPSELALLQAAQRQFMALNDQEQEAFAAVRAGDRQRAMDALFGAVYEEEKQAVRTSLQQLTEAIHQHYADRVATLSRQVDRAMLSAQVLLLASLLLVALVLRRFYHRRVLRPLIELTGKTRQLIGGERDIHYPHADEDSEIGDLSRALRSYQETLGERDVQRERLAQAEAWYRQIIEFSPDGMLIVDSDGQILIANPRAHELFGYAPGRLVGLSVDELVPADIRPRHAQMRARFMGESGSLPMGSMSGDFRAVDRNGREFPVELGLTRLPPLAGRQPCACATLRDISQRKQYEQAIAEQLEFQRVLLDTLPYPVFFKDAAGRYQGFNQAFLDAFQITREALVGKTVTEFVRLPAADRPLYQEANARILRDGGQYSAEMRMPLADGQDHPVIYKLSSYSGADGRVAGLVGSLIDISVQKAAEEAQARAKELAEEATRLKSDFLANMSHEIRTPMNVIMGMAHLALESDPEPRQRNYLEKIHAAAQNLLGIINDILDFSKIEAGKMQFEEVDFCLEDLLAGLADQATLKAQEKGLELLFDIGTDVPTALVGDPMRLGQVLGNLLSNAVKFTAQGEVTVAIHREADSAERTWLRFEVRDTGIGLSAEQCGKLFRAFTQADSSTSRKYGGTGLGLTICKRLVDLMGGEIGVDSTPGVGSTFHFRVPLRRQAAQRELLIDGDDILGMPILVVDDNASAREIFQSMLGALKFEVDTACDAADAIRKLEQAQQRGRPYRLVIMDWMMPGMDGVQAVQAIRSDSRIGEVPLFVMVTAYSREELIESLRDTPVESVLVKPVTPSTLLDSILSTFGRRVAAPAAQPQGQVAYQEARKALEGAYLLLVEDNLVNQEMGREILGRAGIRVDVANNGAEALAMLEGHAYDGVLMDCQMPVMDGFEATRQLRRQAAHADLPVLAMTANTMAGDLERCLEAGMNDHIAKPIDVPQLFLTLHRWIKVRQPQPAVVEVADEQPPLPAVEGLQLGPALQRLGGDAPLLRKLLGYFCANHGEDVARIRQALHDGDRETATRTAHTLKGLAGNIGAERLGRQAAALETQLRQGSGDPQASLTELEGELRDLLARIAAAPGMLPAETAHAQGGHLDLGGLRDGLRRLVGLLRNDDGEAGKCLGELLDALNGLGLDEPAAELQRLIGRYQFDEALALLDGHAALAAVRAGA